jgi:hypothetical protein
VECLSGLFGLKKQRAIVAIIAVFALAVTLNSGRVYADLAGLTLNPNPVTQGTNVLATGSGFPSSENGFVLVFADNTGSCSGSTFFTSADSTDGSGNLGAVTIPTSGLSVGTHCVETDGFVVVGTLTPDNAVSSLIVNQAPPIPEYPIGLAVLAVFMIIAYGVIRRKTRYDYA